MTTQTALSSGTWTELQSGASRVLLQATGDIYVAIATSTPSADAPGFFVRSGDFADLVGLTDFSANVYARAASYNGGGVTYVSA